MKILLVTSVFKPEAVGPARFARLLIGSLNLSVYVLTSGAEESEKVKNVGLQFKWWQRKLKIYFSISQLHKKLLEIESNYDFIIFNNSIFAHKYKGELPYLVMVNDEKLISLKPFLRFDFLRRSLHRRIEKSSVEAAPKIIVNSEYIKGKLLSAYNVDSSSVHTLLKGISLKDKKEHYVHRELIRSIEVKVLFVKNDYLIGGLIELVKALESLNEYKFDLTIAGSESKELNRLIYSDNIKVTVKGMIPNDQVIDLMYKQDILSIPSRFEPLGVAIMEGLAVGIPVVTTNQGGLPEVTNNGEFVWECEPNNSNSIANKILECIENPELRKSKSEEGRRFVRSKFNFETVEKRLLELVKR